MTFFFLQVALVGNGPISPQQRAAIAGAGCIVRLNTVPNMWVLLLL
jgi:hypothetical protein